MSLINIISPQAATDLQLHAAYIGQDSPDAASRFLAAARSTFEFLCENPQAGTVFEIDNPDLPTMRCWWIKGFRNYLIFYVDEGNSLRILRVIHGAKDLPAELQRR